MKIALSMGTLRGAGSSYVGKSILRNICEVGAEHVFHAWIPDNWQTSELELPANCEVHTVAPGARHKLISENIEIRRFLHRESINALFSLGDTSLIHCSIPHLLMVQQAYLAYRPEDWGFTPPLRFAAKMKLITSYFRLGLPSVNNFTVQTEDMKVRLCERWGIKTSRVHVVPSALDFNTTGMWPQRRSTEPYLCYVATPGPHKNFEILPEVMASLVKTWPRLICALTVQSDEVPTLVKKAETLGVLDTFRFLGHLEKAEALNLLVSAKATIIPSHLESFGLGYYEARALGVPIVASDRAFARAACGDSALYAKSSSADEFAAALANVLRGASPPQPRFQDSPWPASCLSYLRIISNTLSEVVK